MLNYALLIAAIIAVFVLTFAAAWMLRREPLRPATRRLLIGLALFEVVLCLLHMTTWENAEITGFWDWFLDIDKELNLGTIFSSAQLMGTGLLAFVIGLRGQPGARWHRAYWWFLAAGFAFLSIDEFFIIHERIFQELRLPGAWWRYVYGGMGALLVGLSLYVHRRWLRDDSRAFGLFFIGLVVMAVSGVALERLIWNALCDNPLGCFNRLVLIEEGFEMVGTTLVLAAFLVYAQKHLAPAAWKLSLRLPLGAGALWAGLLLFSMWGVPLIEAQTLATPTRITYLDGALELIGYRVSGQTIEPGGTLEVTLYWRTHATLPEHYNQSVRLFAKPSGDQVAQYDLAALDATRQPSRVWLPGTVSRGHVSLPVPEDLPAPSSYWVGVRLWHGDWQDSRGVDIDQTTNPRLTADAAAITSVAYAGPAPQDSPTVATDYPFAAGFTLTGYDLPEAVTPGGALALDFWWHADQTPERIFTQFVHLVDADGNYVYGHDQPPFAGHFPTTDWPAGMSAQDAWRIPLPDDLPPGAYSVYTGVYDADTLQRSPVTDAAGQPIPDAAILLGHITIRGARGWRP